MPPAAEVIVRLITAAMAESGLPVVALAPDTNILRDTGLDSMALAVLVVQLEEELGKDPFAEGFINFRTIGELAALYER
ncbi:MAG: acyl carrier protein [Steroidobacteraceae bacterium]